MITRMETYNVWVPKGLPCAKALGLPSFELAEWQECNCQRRVLLLNLMPEKAKTEADIVRTLAATGENCQLIPIKIKGQVYKTTPKEHMDSFYLDFEDVEWGYFERLIITGAPLEQMPFEEVRYWHQLQNIMHWADEHVRSTLYICWGAQAGLYEHYGVKKYPLPEKMFGVFSQKVLNADSPLMRELTPAFLMPNSRHTEVRLVDVLSMAEKGLITLAVSEESGVGIMATTDCKRVFVVGHLEYNAHTLDDEYRRDLSKQLPIKRPLHYYDEDGKICYSWQNDAVTFYRNWVASLSM